LFFSGIVVLSSLARRRRVRDFLLAALPFIALLGITELIFPGLVGLWSESLRNPGGGAVAPQSFTVTTLVGVMRDLLVDQANMIPLWPMVVIPFVPAIGFVLWRLRSKSEFDLVRFWPGVIGISYLFSPYGWVFDAVLLLPCYLHALSILWARGTDRKVGLILIGAQVLSFALLWVPKLKLDQGSFWWLPLLMFVGWLYACTRSDERKPA
jgi:hypothetical protein